MITNELKTKIDSLWTIFWTGGLANPLDVIEQMTYLMFIRSLDEKELEKFQGLQQQVIAFKYSKCVISCSLSLL